MKLYRISSPTYIEDLSGTGAKLYGGRWNEKGTPLLYTSVNISLAMLEILVHFDGLTVPPELSLLQLEIPDDCVIDFPFVKFDKIRKSKDAEMRFKQEGEQWVASNTSLGLMVPSVITTLEHNVLINPKHPDYNKLKKIKVESLDLDSRLFV